MANTPEKSSESYRQHIGERELLDLSRMAAVHERSLSDFVRVHILRPYLYGNVRRLNADSEWPNSAHEFKGE
jgi:hypothetical protein